MLVIILVGAGIAIGFHWIECLIRPSLYSRKLSWIAMIRIPEGIIVAAALKMLGIL